MGGKRALSLSLELTVSSVSARNDGYKEEAYAIPDQAPHYKGWDLGSIFIISSDYGPFQSLIKCLNPPFLEVRNPSRRSHLRYSQAVFWLALSLLT